MSLPVYSKSSVVPITTVGSGSNGSYAAVMTQWQQPVSGGRYIAVMTRPFRGPLFWNPVLQDKMVVNVRWRWKQVTSEGISGGNVGVQGVVRTTGRGVNTPHYWLAASVNSHAIALDTWYDEVAPIYVDVGTGQGQAYSNEERFMQVGVYLIPISAPGGLDASIAVDYVQAEIAGTIFGGSSKIGQVPAGGESYQVLKGDGTWASGSEIADPVLANATYTLSSNAQGVALHHTGTSVNTYILPTSNPSSGAWWSAICYAGSLHLARNGKTLRYMKGNAVPVSSDYRVGAGGVVTIQHIGGGTYYLWGNGIL